MKEMSEYEFHLLLVDFLYSAKELAETLEISRSIELLDKQISEWSVYTRETK